MSARSKRTLPRVLKRGSQRRHYAAQHVVAGRTLCPAQHTVIRPKHHSIGVGATAVDADAQERHGR
jgi:hypothetical protein